MANKNSKNTKSSESKEYFSITGMKLNNVRRIPGTEVISFSLIGKGAGFYNLKVVKGSRGEFIAAPSTKGRDGEYYAQYALYLTDEDQKKVIAAVKAKLPDDEPEEPEVDF